MSTPEFVASLFPIQKRLGPGGYRLEFRELECTVLEHGYSSSMSLLLRCKVQVFADIAEEK